MTLLRGEPQSQFGSRYWDLVDPTISLSHEIQKQVFPDSGRGVSSPEILPKTCRKLALKPNHQHLTHSNLNSTWVLYNFINSLSIIPLIKLIRRYLCIHYLVFWRHSCIMVFPSLVHKYAVLDTSCIFSPPYIKLIKV